MLASEYMQYEYQTEPMVDTKEVRQTMARRGSNGRVKNILQGINILLP